MKKAVIVGGSSGIGLAISRILINKGYFIEICSRSAPKADILNQEKYHFNYCNLLDFNEELFHTLALDEDVEVLIITAGIGRIAEFYAHHTAEIQNIFMVDTVSTIKILRIFYSRILSKVPFYSSVVGSISGWVSTPAASVYAAAKAGIVRFIESVNIELEVAETNNRILDVSPACFKGSRFYGGENDLSLLEPLAREIVEHIFNRDTLFIPHYKEKFKDIIDRYVMDPHEYGIYSYHYKKQSGRIDNSKKVIIGYLSGTFDLFHIGHLNLLQRAKEQCDYLIVGVHDSGAWKGKETFIPFEERKAIVGSVRYVDRVVDSCEEDSDAWEILHYDRLFVGSDYKGTERFIRYEEFFKDKGVEIVYFPYTKSTSSTQIRGLITSKIDNLEEQNE